METALNPAVTPMLIPAIVAIVVIAMAVGAIVAAIGRFRHWVEGVAQTRIEAIEARDIERASAVRRSFEQTDTVAAELHRRIDDVSKRIDDLCALIIKRDGDRDEDR